MWHRARTAGGHAAGLRAFARVYAGWGLSQAFYGNERYRELGFSSVDDFLTGFWEANFAGHETVDLMAMLWTWQHADIGATEGYHDDVTKALGAITARLLALPAQKDLYFPPEDEAWASAHIPHGDIGVIPGGMGPPHRRRRGPRRRTVHRRSRTATPRHPVHPLTKPGGGRAT
ncbi:hypothetical protein LO772_32770 [Yinghuangia sp. ASG 101]|uniref:hypothetical protein n=1 Tax=Yinghuangia sp. ASG 101 TaxID=2896848 RepID=UPI001E5C7FFE|nr:hypothetical protein [Yinghuangia sp. ASG 101]UGQ11503.1 hypothetical protein LO772_32770 [Yinghuangia sp. ASG 101]